MDNSDVQLAIENGRRERDKQKLENGCQSTINEKGSIPVSYSTAERLQFTTTHYVFYKELERMTQRK